MLHSPMPAISNPPIDVDHLPTRDGYDRWAAIYDVELNPLVAIEEPHVDALLGDVRGLNVLDVGCGTGRHAIRLAHRGGIVTAIDFSQGMLDQARRKAGDAPIRFMQHDLATHLPLPDQSFDRVLCGLVLDHIADLPLLLGEMKRVCKADVQAGRPPCLPATTGETRLAGTEACPTDPGQSDPGPCIIVSVMHPAMMLRGVQARFVDPATGRETRPASVANQISDYVMAALDAGLVIDHLSEHAVDADLAHRMPRAEKYVGWPLLLMMRLRA
jgi:malonyl-CoA O-methyltransferase